MRGGDQRPDEMSSYIRPEQRQLRAIREELDDAHIEWTAPAVKPTSSASPIRLSSKART